MKIVLSSIYPYVFSALFLILPFDEYARSLPNILLIILVVAFPSVIEKADFSRIKKMPFFIFCAFALYLVLNTVITGRSETNFAVVNKVLVSLGLVMLYLPVRDIQKVNKAIIFSALAAILFSMYSIVLVINQEGIFNIGNPLRSVDTLLIDRQYLGLLSVCSILISYWSMKKTYDATNKYYLANIIINILFVFLIVSRYAVIALLVLAVIKQFYGKKRLLKISVAIAIIGLLSVIVYSIKDTTAKRFVYAEDYVTNPTLVKDSSSFDPRKEIWSCAASIINDEGFIISGFGFQGTKNALQKCYQDQIEDPSVKEWFGKKKYNTHNQYLDFFMSSGIIALGVLLFWFLYTFFKNRNNFTLTSFLIAIAAYGVIENFFHRQIGAYYFGFFLIVLLIEHKKNLPSKSVL
jgi:O-antigen ligase